MFRILIILWMDLDDENYLGQWVKPWNGPRHGLSPIEKWDLKFLKENHNKKLNWLTNIDFTLGLSLSVVGREGQSSISTNSQLQIVHFSLFILHLNRWPLSITYLPFLFYNSFFLLLLLSFLPCSLILF